MPFFAGSLGLFERLVWSGGFDPCRSIRRIGAVSRTQERFGSRSRRLEGSFETVRLLPKYVFGLRVWTSSGKAKIVSFPRQGHVSAGPLALPVCVLNVDCQ